MAADADTLGFAFRQTKRGDVVITRQGKSVTTLRGGKSIDFLNKIATSDPAARQQLMARETGNYKRGNERLASTHSRSRA